MAQTASTMLPLGTPAPAFSLPEPATGKIIALADFHAAPALLVIFMCNHCPFVKHIRQGLIDFARDYQPRKLAMIAISANDSANYPGDSPAQMAEETKAFGYSFPYLYDETQATAKAYRAACTPISFCSTAPANWFIAASLMTAGPAIRYRLRALTCGRRRMRSWRVNPSGLNKSPASAAISNGKPGMRRIIPVEQR